ncbi:Origin recognition complex subunit 1 [Nosema granulosis]|uniref:Origin recognition complex subunit 1 n=1 Tax=Nosema granulosis TaxID=83296 RepID=A0A9P6H1D3_9MICR|nr:Origin recognition complex subunit 1 [Nosema granulosis]
MSVKGREKEYKELKRYVSKFVKDGISTSLYVSGVPGSGKTFTLKYILEEMSLDFIYVNCAYLKRKKMIYKEICDTMKCEVLYNVNSLIALRNHLSVCKSKHITIIDEVDLLIDNRQEILYNIFDLPHIDNSKILLILISNTMNLPEKMFESKICSRIGKNRLNFKPYTHVQINKILSDTEINKINREIISRKVGSVSGDIRKAINITKRVEDDRDSISGAFETMYQPLSIRFLKLLSYYQKFILFVFVEYKEDKYARIFENHKIVCNTKDIEPLQWFEFEDVMESLKSFKIINFNSSKQKVSLNVFKEDLETALSKDESYNSFRTQKGD